MIVHHENLPEKLKQTGLFCLWKYQKEFRNGKEETTKVPYNPNYPEYKQKGDPSNKGRFSNFEKALEVLNKYNDFYDGLAIGVFDCICAIDIDDCVHDGIIDKQAQWIIDRMKCYTEFSPSGNGIRIIFLVKPDFKYNTEEFYIHNRARKLEIYIAGSTNKVVTVTGNAIRTGDLEEKTYELLEVAQRYMRRKSGKDGGQGDGEENNNGLSDDEIIQKASAAVNGEEFKRLWEGDSSGFESNSEAVLSLCVRLAFWTGKDPERMDSLFRQSGLMSEKWDSKRGGSTWGAQTIQEAMKRCLNVYKPPTVKPKASAADNSQDKENAPLIWTNLSHIEEKQIEWLVPGYIPRKGLTVLGGDGGVGKSSIECALAAAVSAGRQTFLTEYIDFSVEPGRVVLLNAEDPYGEVLKPILTAYEAKQENIIVMDEKQIKESGVAYSDDRLKESIARFKPDLIIFDPLQAFLPDRVKMAERNAMRRELNHALAMAEVNNCAVLIVMHTNKQQKVSGRQRLADTADLWDLSRSVLMAGVSSEDGTRHITHEKSNFGKLQESIVFDFDEARRIKVIERNTKRDKDYMQEAMGARSGTTATDEATDHIIQYLQEEGEIKIADLQEAMKALGVSSKAFRTAKKRLKDSAMLRYRKTGKGKGQGVDWYVSLSTNQNI